MVDVRGNWRVFLLVFVLVASTFALFSPTVGGAGGEGTAADGPTNLQYGLELSGGTRVRAPLVGVTAGDVDFEPGERTQVERDVADQLEEADPTDVTARAPGRYLGVTQESGTVEVLVENVTADELGTALERAGYGYGETRDGVTEVTRIQTVNVLENKINEAGLSGGTVQQVQTSTGESFILVQVPNRERSEVIELVNTRGSVRIDIYHPVEENGTTGYERREAVLTEEDFANVDPAQEGEGGQPPYVPVQISGSTAPEFQQAVVDTGLAREGGTTCRYDESPNSTEACLLLVQDGEVVNSFGMSPSLAGSMRAGEWENDPQFILQTRNFSEAQQVALNLQAGALPAKLDLTGPDGGTSSYISPSQGASFVTDSLLAGIIAVLAVSGVVFVRYREPRVALPMIVTAMSEVVVLLGLAAAIGYPLDLSVIAGFIAVIGTGVDDLIIIADEVMAQGDVSSRRVFQSRFRKAFWVIGAAAATTIIAMSPLAILSLGDLQGFAIFTILGVVVGVLLTRPAYGDILRMLLTSDH